ncbi:MAG TPA: hypothetical protein VKC56_06930 [Gallionellaceae bacterium]|nr:hypothetical protein [Gallionellaceae bacterium]
MDQETEKRLQSALMSEWCDDGGFMHDLRYGKFNEEAYLRMRDIVAEIDFSGEERISKRLVSLFYRIPDWIAGHRDRVLENGGSKILCDSVYAEVTTMVLEKFAEKDFAPD